MVRDLPADLLPLWHTPLVETEPDWKAGAGWQQQWQQHVLHNKLQSFICPGMQSTLQSDTLLALPPPPSCAWALEEQP